jgi:receptor expression-enhancing protein 5/6
MFSGELLEMLVEFVTFGLLIAVFFYFQGSKHVYKKYLRPFFLKHQAKIDRFLNILSKELVSVLFIIMIYSPPWI